MRKLLTGVVKFCETGRAGIFSTENEIFLLGNAPEVIQTNMMKSVRLTLQVGLVTFAFISCRKSTVAPTLEGDWAKQSPLVMSKRTEAVSFVINNTAYVGTGFDGLVVHYNDFWKYDEVNDSWTQVASMPAGTERNSAVAFSLNGKGYVGTGFDGNHYLNDFYKYDPATDSWSQIASLAGNPRYEAVAFGIGNSGYVGTGFDGDHVLNDFYQYDPSSDKWNSIPFNGNARFGAVSWVFEDQAYVVTGTKNGVLQTDFWVFDPKSDTSKWTKLRSIADSTGWVFDDGYATIARWNASVAVVGNQAILCMGQSGSLSPYINSHSWIYSMDTPGNSGGQTDVWAEKTSFEGSPTTGATSFSLTSSNGGGGFFLVPGTTVYKEGIHYSELWQFFPTRPPDSKNN